ncbi:MAG: M23 family metallopeptidase [Syntrophobacterales bacterium]|nr:M23 family metallopeptidase [Syntrophobacterales bacterium]
MLHDKKNLFISLLILLFITACATTSGPGRNTNGVYHRVKEGETLWRISQAYNCDLDKLAEANNLPDSRIEAGSVLFIPNAASTISIKPGTTSYKTADTAKKEPPETTRKNRAPAPGKVSDKKTSQSYRPGFIWPVKGRVSSKFGVYKGIQHNGIKINGKEGTSILASAGGTVIHSAPIKYYGETIIIKHNSIYSTVYSHLKKRTVYAGSTVRRGDKIGLLGREEKTGKPCLHFEIRYKNRAKNPLYYLPK